MVTKIGTRHIVLTGCSGGGKSTLLAELGRRGFETVAEPGRRIVAAELAGTGSALPWVDLEAFAQCAIELAAIDLDRVAHDCGWVFFDRGLIDAAVALQHANGTPISATLKDYPRFHPAIFMAPPWIEIYQTDHERTQDFEDGVQEYHRLLKAYVMLGYEVVTLPKSGVEERADFVLNRLARHGTGR